MRKLLTTMLLMLTVALTASAQGITPKDTPQLEFVMQLKVTLGEVYTVGGHNEMRNIDIVKRICQKLGKPESLITFVADRKGHDMRYAIVPTKIHRELDWLPETKFADGIDKTIDWYLSHRDWWETIISGEYRSYYDKMYGHRELSHE